jgi:hypothetical protein
VLLDIGGQLLVLQRGQIKTMTNAFIFNLFLRKHEKRNYLNSLKIQSATAHQS